MMTSNIVADFQHDINEIERKLEQMKIDRARSDEYRKTLQPSIDAINAALQKLPDGYPARELSKQRALAETNLRNSASEMQRLDADRQQLEKNKRELIAAINALAN